MLHTNFKQSYTTSYTHVYLLLSTLKMSCTYDINKFEEVQIIPLVITESIDSLQSSVVKEYIIYLSKYYSASQFISGPCSPPLKESKMVQQASNKLVLKGKEIEI